MSKVSVIIPAYNAERFLKQTLESVFSQTYTNFEVLVIDDGSQDETSQVVKSFGNSVKYIRKSNSGVSDTRNVGIKEAKGTYLAFLDADDLWEPTKLEKQVNVLESNSECGLCFTAVQRIDENNLPLNKIEAIQYEDFSEALLLYSCVVSGSCSSAMIRKDLVEVAGFFDKRYKNYEDWEYWLRLSLHTNFIAIPEYLVKYRLVNDSATFNTQSAESAVRKILDEFFKRADLPQKYVVVKNKSYSNNLMILAGEYLHAKKYADSLRCLFDALKIQPSNLKRPLYLPFRWTKRIFASKM